MCNISLDSVSILRPLARGGESTVYLGEYEGCRLAVKIYNPNIRPSLNALRLFSSVCHEKVFVKLHSFGVDSASGCFYEIFEYLERGDLADYILAGGDLSVSNLLRLISQLQVALRLLHGNNLIFADIKPQNILIRDFEPLSVALCDFGEMMLADGSCISVDSFYGSLGFAAPEAHAAVLDFKSDYWSLGMLIYWLLTKRNPIAGYFKEPFFLALSRRSGEVLPVPDNLPEGFAVLLKGLLTVDPRMRWGGEQLDRFLRGERGIPVFYGDMAPELELEIDWIDSTMPLRDRIKWKSAQFNSLDAEQWRGVGFSFREAVEWRAAGFCYKEAHNLRIKGFDPKGAVVAFKSV